MRRTPMGNGPVPYHNRFEFFKPNRFDRLDRQGYSGMTLADCPGEAIPGQPPPMGTG